LCEREYQDRWQHKVIPQDYVLKSVTVSKTPSGKHYANILYEYEQTIEPVEVRTAIELDYSEGAVR